MKNVKSGNRSSAAKGHGELRFPDFTFFMRGCYKNFHFKSMFQTTVQPLVSMLCADVTLGRSRLSFRILRLWTAG